MKAILEMEAPESCVDERGAALRCPFAEYPRNGSVDCTILHKRIPYFKTTRHPDCPLKIIDDGSRWIYTKVDKGNTRQLYTCPKCEISQALFPVDIFNYCPLCGVKLLPPEEA